MQGRRLARSRFPPGRRDRRSQLPGTLYAPRISLLNSRTSSFSRSAMVRVCPHSHSKFVRSSESQSSLSPKRVSRSPHPHSRIRCPEHSTVLSDSIGPSICSPFRSPLGESNADGAEGGNAPPAILSVPKGEAGTRPRGLPPSDNPREVCPGKQAETQSTTRENGDKIYRGNLEGMGKVECC